MAFLQDRLGRGPLAEWSCKAFERARPLGHRSSRGGFQLFAPRRQKAASEHLYFNVRWLPVGGGRHVLQYGFVDDRGNIVLSVFGEGWAAGRGGTHGWEAPPEDLAAAPMDAEWLGELIGSVCQGASLVAFHRVLQGGLLPKGAIDGAASVECAWRRYLRVARARGDFDRGEPVTLDDALESAGVGAVGSPDAALRALGVRELWAWMDKVE
ncbi:MAG TPA: hypothetical protein VHZ26_13315 [Caulobacteraceae bacterium]|nr:hypothetical protein [Caulobacteraceae bacterium]